MTPLILALLLAVVVLVGLCGIVVPVLPGSVMIGLAGLAWAVWGNSSWGWACCGVVAVLVAAGMSASLLLTRRDLARREIPRWPVLVGAAGALAGSFLLPVVGTVAGFAVGLFLAELVRVKELRQAAGSSLVALRSFGVGILVELGCALAACSVLATSILTALL